MLYYWLQKSDKGLADMKKAKCIMNSTPLTAEEETKVWWTLPLKIRLVSEKGKYNWLCVNTSQCCRGVINKIYGKSPNQVEITIQSSNLLKEAFISNKTNTIGGDLSGRLLIFTSQSQSALGTFANSETL